MNKTDQWLETRWQVAKSESEVFLTVLDQMGCLGAFENLDIDLEKEALKPETLCLAYFPDRANPDDLLQTLKKLESAQVKFVSCERIPYGDWATAWKEFFHPFNLTPQVVICPSWETYQAKVGEHVVILDPGMAFGTGQHDTTRFCAEFLCEVKDQGKPYATVLDVGCGSGILSFIAKKMGAERVLGVDNDVAAVETSIENLERNPDLQNVAFAKTDGSLTDVVHQTYDVVAANIIAEALCELKDTLVSFVKPGGFLILSGILPQRSEMVQDSFKGLKQIGQKTSDNWHTFLYQK